MSAVAIIFALIATQIPSRDAESIVEAQDLRRQLNATQFTCIKDNARSLDDGKELAETIAMAAARACAESADKAIQIYALELMLSKNFSAEEAVSYAIRSGQGLTAKFREDAILEILNRRRETRKNLSTKE